MALVFGGPAIFSGCAAIIEALSELESVDAEFYYEPHSASIAHAYSVKLPEHPMIRQGIIHSFDPISDTDIYVRDGEDEWKLFKEIKRHRGGHPNQLASTREAVRVIPKTYANGVTTMIQVYAVRE